MWRGIGFQLGLQLRVELWIELGGVRVLVVGHVEQAIEVDRREDPYTPGSGRTPGYLAGVTPIWRSSRC